MRLLTCKQPTRMVCGGVFGEKRRRGQGGVIRVIRVRGVYEPVGVAGREQRARGRAPVQDGRGRGRHRHARREDQRRPQRGGGGPQRRRGQPRDGGGQQPLRLGGGGGDAPPLLVASWWTAGHVLQGIAPMREFRLTGR